MRAELKKARKKLRLTVNELAVSVNISPSFYYKIESGSRNPTIGLAKRIAQTLNSNVEILFFEENLDQTSNKM